MRFCIDYSKRGTASCRKCKQKIEKNVLRIAKIVVNTFSESGGDLKQWHHIDCIFDSMKSPRAVKLQSVDELEGFCDLEEKDKQDIEHRITQLLSSSKGSKKSISKVKPSTSKESVSVGCSDECSNDNMFCTFQELCDSVANEASYNEKTSIFSKFFKNGSNKKGFKGDLYSWLKLLLPNVENKVYNLQNKQLIKTFALIFDVDHESMLDSLNDSGDISEVISEYYAKSKSLRPKNRSVLSLNDVDVFLDELTEATKEDDQISILKRFVEKATSKDLKTFIRLIKRDLRINAGPKHVLSALHEDAYEAFQTSRDLKTIAFNITNGNLSMSATVMTPIIPMLAEACRNIDHAFAKCSTIFAEIKYDGERVQVHKSGDEFKYYSRSLKPVLNHKVEHFHTYITKAIPSGNSLILDGEIVLFNTSSDKPLPFGTLGVHKKQEFKDATVCLFLFDCMYFNGEHLMNNPFTKRRTILEENVNPIKGHVMLSKIETVKNREHLKTLMENAIRSKLEGLVLKDSQSLYEPGKRHWLKMKKDYLDSGSMADSADLVVLGAYYGTGNKGGKMSIFLMGCYDPNSDKWLTVCKVGNGHDDNTIEKLQKELKDIMKPIRKDPDLVPVWVKINRSLVPDFIVTDPKKAPVWEITGAEFSKANVHTANGISIRFPRVTRIRDDKTWKEATNMTELIALSDNSTESWSLTNCGSESSTIRKREFTFSDSSEGSPSKRTRLPVEVSKGNDVCSPVKAEEGLPSLFHGLRLLFSSKLNDNELLKRYVIAYDGEIVGEDDITTATHVVVEKDEQLSEIFEAQLKSQKSKTMVVEVTWLWNSIKLCKLLSCKKYLRLNLNSA